MYNNATAFTRLLIYEIVNPLSIFLLSIKHSDSEIVWETWNFNIDEHTLPMG